MSQENVDVVMHCFELFGRGDMEALLRHVELKELIDAGGDVVAITCHHGRGRASGVVVEGLVAYVFTVDDGKLVRMRIFNTKAEPLEAVRLRE